MGRKLTKKQQGMLWSHEHAKIIEFSQLYNKPSDAKKSASIFCENEYREYNGFNKRYHSKNCFRFSFSYKYIKDNKVHLRYHTAFDVYDFIIDDEFVKVV